MIIRMRKKENIEFFIKRFKKLIESKKILEKLKLKKIGYLNKSKIKKINKKNKIKKIQKSIRKNNFFKKLY